MVRNLGNKCEGKGKCVIYDGKAYPYKNQQQLADKLDIDLRTARELIRNNGVPKLLINDRDEIMKIDLKENFKPMLRKEFKIVRIPNKKVIPALLRTPTPPDNYIFEGQEIFDGIGGDARVNVLILIVMELSWASGSYASEKDLRKMINNPDIAAQYPEGTNLEGKKHNTALIPHGDASASARRAVVIPYTGKVKNIPGYVSNYIVKYAKRANAESIDKLRFAVQAPKGLKQLEWRDMILRDDFSYNLTEYCNIIYVENNGRNCVRYFLREKYPRVSKSSIANLGTSDGVSVKQIINFCKVHKIPYKIYDVRGKLRYEGDCESKSYGLLSFIAYNNHIYPLDGKFPRRKKITGEYKITNGCYDEIKKFVGVEKKVVSDIQVNLVYHKNENGETEEVLHPISYVYQGIKYIENDEYEKCLNILKKFDLEDRIYDSIRLNDLGSVIANSLIKENIDSFFPREEDEFRKIAFMYKTDNEIDHTRKISTIDKNKAHLDALRNLPYLIVCDWRLAKIRRHPKKIEKDYFLYIAKPKYNNILIPNTNIYAGGFLRKCKSEGCEFTLLEEISCTMTPNYYSKIINKIIKKIDDMSLIKSMVNIMIGKMEKAPNVGIKYEQGDLLNNNEAKTISGRSLPIDKKHSIVFNEIQTVKNVYSRLPITFQIKDECRYVAYKKMLELGLKNDDIIQIRSDAITYYGKLPKDLDKNNISGWKEEKWNPIENTPEEYLINDMTFFIRNRKTEYDENDEDTDDDPKYKYTRNLFCCFAGVGKTTYFLNTVIPILEANNIKYRVLAPSHAALERYKEAGVPCDVIQKYTLQNEIPSEEYIIVDEVGMLDKKGHDLLYKLSLMEKNYEVAGDFNQLPPIEKNCIVDGCNENYFHENFNSRQINSYLYNNQTTPKDLMNNMRNNFPFEYYQLLQNKQIDVLKEVIKYSTKKPIDAEYVLCRTNKTRDKYNEYIMKEKGLTQTSVGVRLICKTNEFVLNENPICNGEVAEIIKKYRLETKNGHANLYELSGGQLFWKKEIKKYFRVAFALNVYNIQGNELDSYYWAKEDDHCLKGDDAGRISYLIISRLRGKVYKGDMSKDIRKFKKENTKSEDIEESEGNESDNEIDHEACSIWNNSRSHELDFTMKSFVKPINSQELREV